MIATAALAGNLAHYFLGRAQRHLREIIAMTRLWSRLLFLVMFCLTFAAPAHAEKRVALVIGNGFYQYQPPLFNPKHDAEDVAKALGDLNFDVVLGLDLTRAGMNEKLDEFSRKADGADIAFVYYSGHGMQFSGSNYLLPTDASLDSAADVNPFRLVRIDTVMETLRAVNGPKIVVLDACRDNPVENELKRRVAVLRGTRGAEVTRGLSPISASGSGLLVAYATQPDHTAFDGKGRNSPFTAAFIENVGAPDTDIRQMFFRVQDQVVRDTDGKQQPEISVSLVGAYKLKITITPAKPGESLPATVIPAAPVAGGPGEAERTWGYVKDTASPKALEDFINRFPNTIFAELAREKLEQLKAKAQVAVAAPPAVPAVPSNDEQTRRERSLYRAAVGNLDLLKMYLSSCSICEFRTDAKVEIASLEREMSRSKEEAQYREARGNYDKLGAYVSTCAICEFRDAAAAERAWSTVQSTTNIAALEEFIRRFADTSYAKPARERLDQLTAKAAAVPNLPSGSCKLVAGHFHCGN
jgi:hypothetical protein